MNLSISQSLNASSRVADGLPLEHPVQITGQRLFLRWSAAHTLHSIFFSMRRLLRTFTKDSPRLGTGKS